jgi:hypothetical protein
MKNTARALTTALLSLTTIVGVAAAPANAVTGVTAPPATTICGSGPCTLSPNPDPITNVTFARGTGWSAGLTVLTFNLPKYTGNSKLTDIKVYSTSSCDNPNRTELAHAMGSFAAGSTQVFTTLTPWHPGCSALAWVWITNANGYMTGSDYYRLAM